MTYARSRIVCLRIPTNRRASEQRCLHVWSCASSVAGWARAVRELYRRYGRGRGIDAAAFHPGDIAPEYLREARSSFRWIYQMSTRRRMGGNARTRRRHARAPCRGAARSRLSVRTILCPGQVAKPNKQAYDRMLAFELWYRSETLIDDGATNDRSLRPFVPAHSRHTRGVLWWLSRNIDESATFR